MIKVRRAVCEALGQIGNASATPAVVNRQRGNCIAQRMSGAERHCPGMAGSVVHQVWLCIAVCGTARVHDWLSCCAVVTG